MSNKVVTLIRYCKTPLGWKRLPVVLGRNGKLKPGYAMLNGEPTHLPEGHYVLRTYEGKLTVYKNVSNDPVRALAAQQKESRLVIMREQAQAAGVKIVEPENKRLDLQKKKDEFIARHVAKGQTRASQTSLIAIDDFLDATKHTQADQITEASILTFYRELRRRGNQDRTVYNKHISLFGWFKWMGLDTKKLAEHAPNYTEREVEEFNGDDIKALFAACNEYQKVVFETLLKTGMRMQEAMHLEWVKVDFRRKVIKVREILDSDTGDNFNIKDKAERSVPLPDDLAESLQAWKKERPETRLVLGTRNDTPNWKWLQMLKRLVRNAGLNCGHCPGCRGTKECSRWKLKTFRSTYTTTMLRNGIDPRTLMEWTGHEDLATIMKYLVPSKDPKLQKRISAIRWD